MNIKTTYKEKGVSTFEAKQIINLLNTNEWSRPSKPYTVEEVLSEQDFFIADDENNKVVGFLRLKKVQWYQWELYNLVVDKQYRKSGIAQILITSVKEYVSTQKGGIVQLTIDPENTASVNLFIKMGWKYAISFIHPAYKKPYGVWNINL